VPLRRSNDGNIRGDRFDARREFVCRRATRNNLVTVTDRLGGEPVLGLER
jgi:hypothetical protein